MPEFIRRYYEMDRPIELRPVELGRYFGEKIDDGRINVWIRTAAKLPDDPALHMCALAYASDFSLLDAVMARYGRTLFDSNVMPASLYHRRGFTGPSAPTNGCFTRRIHRARKAAAGWPAASDISLQARRHAGGVGGAGRVHTPAQVEAYALACVPSLGEVRLRHVPLWCTSASPTGSE